MKCKLFLSFIISALSTLCLLLGNEIVAYASDYVFDVRVETVSSAEATSYNQAVINSGLTNAMAIQANDYKISICLTSNLGYNICAMSVDYSLDYFDLLTKINGAGVVYLEGEAAADGMMVSKNTLVIDGENIGRVGLSIIGIDIVYEDGAIMSFFLRKKAGTQPSVVENIVKSLNIVNLYYSVPGDVHEIDYENNSSSSSQSNGFYLRSETYLCGDMDEDGDVDALDAQMLTSLLNAQTGTNHTISIIDLDGTYSYTNSSGTHTFDKLMIVTAANVDQNGIIDYDDALAILEYYADHVVSGIPYDGVIGTYVTGYQFVTYGSTP
jgi:hypothetical protein